MVTVRNFERWLDIDLASEATRTGNFTGCNPNVAEPGTFRAVFEDKYAAEVYPRETWPDLIARKDAESSWISDIITRIFNQLNEGACVSDTAGQLHESLQALQYGRKRVIHVSAISLYKRCGRSPSSGSTLDKNINELQVNGILPLNDEVNVKRFRHCMPNTGFYEPFPDGWKDTAALFRGHEYLDITSWEGFVSCLIRGYPIMYARNSHCITGVRLFYQSKKFILGYCNSWGKWGDVLNATFAFGMGYDSETLAARAAYGAVCMRSVRSPQGAGEPEHRLAV